MADTFRKSCSSLRNTAVNFTVVFLCCSFLTACGLPSPGDVADPPFNVNAGANSVTFNLRNSHALAIYYRFITQGSTVEENFGNITTDGEKALSTRGYYRTNNLKVYIWVPTGPVVDPVTVTLDYATTDQNATITVTDSAGTVFVSNEIVLRNSTMSAPNIGFASPMPAYKDTSSFSSGPVDVAIAATSYKLNPATVQLSPSVPRFLCYMRNLQIS